MSKTTQAIVLGSVCLLLTVGICVQIKTIDNIGSTVSTNSQINNLKSQVLKMKEKYEESYERLESAQNQLENVRTNATNNNEELKELEEKIKKNNILMGTTEVKGPGVIITVQDAPTNAISTDPIVHDTDILEIVNELKNAGAEAIDVNGQRIINTTEISCDGNVIVVNGVKIGTPFTISAIGLQARFNTLKRPGGYLEKMEDAYIKVDFELSDNITIPKYNGVNKTFKYAKTVK